jgi:hypothetical protein
MTNVRTRRNEGNKKKYSQYSKDYMKLDDAIQIQFPHKVYIKFLPSHSNNVLKKTYK